MEDTKVQIKVELGSTGEYKDGVYTGECYLTFPKYSMLTLIVPDMSDHSNVIELIERGIAWHEEQYPGLPPVDVTVGVKGDMVFDVDTCALSFLPQ